MSEGAARDKFEFVTTKHSGGSNTNINARVVAEVGSLYDRLQGLEDQRQRRGIRYPLAVILLMVLLAKLAGEDTPHGIAAWLKHRREGICGCLGFERGTTPHATTVGRVLGGAVVVETLDGLVGEYLAAIQASSEAKAAKGDNGCPLTPVAMDGKTLRGTIPSGQAQGVHLLAIYSPTQEAVLMQLAVERRTRLSWPPAS
jgi:hypothetical protein